MTPYKSTPTLATFVLTVAGIIAGVLAVKAGSIGWGIILLFAGVIIGCFFSRVELIDPDPELSQEDIEFFEELDSELESAPEPPKWGFAKGLALGALLWFGLN
jgi:hypothetical protein